MAAGFRSWMFVPLFGWSSEPEVANEPSVPVSASVSTLGPKIASAITRGPKSATISRLGPVSGAASRPV